MNDTINSDESLHNMNSYSNNNNSNSNSNSITNPLVKKTKSIGNKKLISQAKTFSQLYYNNNDFRSPSKATQTILTIKMFTLESILLQYSDIIRNVLLLEQEDLQTEIMKLNNDMDLQSQSLSVSNSYKNSCVLCTSSNQSSSTSINNKSILKNNFICSKCKVKYNVIDTNSHDDSHYNSYNTKKSNNNNSTSPIVEKLLVNNNLSPDSSSTSPSPRGSSKFRSRLNTARDELFFLDEF